MTQSPSQLGNNMYRVVLISPDPRECLAEYVNGSARLPQVAIPKWTRPAEEISRVIKDSWGLNVVVLDLFDGDGDGPGCVIAELFGSKRGLHLNSNSGWCSVAGLVTGELRESELPAVERLVTTGSTGRGAFSRFGWIDDAITWLASEVSDHEFHFRGDFQQLNATATFSLIRLGNTMGPAYWLKAVGEPNLHELAVTMTLARMFPGYLPECVATRPAWNAWVMKDAGHRLTEPILRHEVESATMRLAELQTSAIGCEKELLSAGCFDQRYSVLREHIPELVEYLIHAMTGQTSTKAPRVSSSRQREIGSILLDACTEMEALGVPITLIHNDVSFGNILFDGSQAFFTDWAEACAGIPTLTYQHLRHYVSREAGASVWVRELDDIYKRCWRDLLSESQMDKALILSPLLSLGSHLFGRGTWMHSKESEAPDFQRYARGLARHMDKAAAAPELMEALCI